MIVFSEKLLDLMQEIEDEGKKFDQEQDYIYSIEFDVDELFHLVYNQGITIGAKYYEVGECQEFVELLNRCAEEGGVYEV